MEKERFIYRLLFANWSLVKKRKKTKSYMRYSNMHVENTKFVIVDIVVYGKIR